MKNILDAMLSTTSHHAYAWREFRINKDLTKVQTSFGDDSNHIYLSSAILAARFGVVKEITTSGTITNENRVLH